MSPMDAINSVQWKHGLVSAFIGGLAGAIDSGLALLIMDPHEFNLGSKLWHTLLVVLVLAILTGVKVAAAYLKQSPTPWSGEDRRNGTLTNSASAGK